MTWLVGLMGKVPSGLITRLAIGGLLVSIGIGIGQHWANQAAIKIVNDVRADEFRKATWQLAKAQNDFAKRLEQERATQAAADAAAFKVYQDGIATATKSRNDALSALARERLSTKQLNEANNGLKKVNEILAAEQPSASCILSARMRRELNAAANAAPYPERGNPETAAPGVSDVPDPSAQPLTCEQLARGYIDLANHDRMLTGWILAWQRWAFEALQ